MQSEMMILNILFEMDFFRIFLFEFVDDHQRLSLTYIPSGIGARAENYKYSAS